MMKTEIKNKIKKAAAVFFLGALVFWPFAQAQATFVSPKRVIIHDGGRAAQVTIHNGTDKTMIYRFSLEDRVQKPGGAIELLGEGETVPGFNSAQGMLHFSPRQVVLKPNSYQKIRILVRRPANLPDGEYHSHLLIKSEPAGDSGFKEDAAQPGLKGLFQIRANVSIPVFVRQGATQIDVTLNDAALFKKDGKTMLRLDISNNSTRSFYARSELVCVSASGETVSKTLPTVRIYTEGKTIKREMSVPEDFPLDSCTTLTYKLMGTDDIEYRNKPIKEIAVRR